KPGLLTKQYVSGKRASFIHPIRLYIFLSIVFFLVVLSGSSSKENSLDNNGYNKITTAREDSISLAEAREALASVPNASARKALQKTIDVAERQKKRNSGKTDLNYSYGPSMDTKTWVLSQDTTYEAYLNRTNRLPVKERPGFMKKYMAKNQIKFRGEDGRQKFKESLMKNVPKMMFLLLPLFAAMLHIFYIRKKRYYYEDLIYSFHLHSFIFLAFLVVKLLIWLTGFVIDLQGWLIFFLTLYIIWYIYRSLRVFYDSSRWMTVLKMCFLSFGYLILLTICFIIVALVTVMMQ
ncbi:MAG: DUF3667 domain-containing protein, partial [Sphingobacteriales bacterium]